MLCRSAFVQVLDSAPGSAAYTLPNSIVDPDKISTVRTLLERHAVSADVLTALWGDLEHVPQEKKSPLFDRLFNPANLKAPAWDYYMEPFSWDSTGQAPGRDQQASARFSCPMLVCFH